jgi:hypothetical protein
MTKKSIQLSTLSFLILFHYISLNYFSPSRRKQILADCFRALEKSLPFSAVTFTFNTLFFLTTFAAHMNAQKNVTRAHCGISFAFLITH